MGVPVFPRLVIVGYSPETSYTVPCPSLVFIVKIAFIFLSKVVTIYKPHCESASIEQHFGFESILFFLRKKHTFFVPGPRLGVQPDLFQGVHNFLSSVSHFQVGVLLQCCCVAYLSRLETQVESLWKQYKSFQPMHRLHSNAICSAMLWGAAGF